MSSTRRPGSLTTAPSKISSRAISRSMVAGSNRSMSYSIDPENAPSTSTSASVKSNLAVPVPAPGSKASRVNSARPTSGMVLF